MAQIDNARENKERQRLFVGVLQDRGELDRVEEFVDPDVVDHSLPPGVPGGQEGVRVVLGAIRAGFPDHDAEVIHMVSEGDLVATYKTFTGTHTGDFFGIPPTGKTVEWTEMAILRIGDGKILATWFDSDIAGLMQQLGVAG